jgi:hypothetical protein
MLPGLCKLATLKQCKSLFGSLSGARLRANGIFLLHVIAKKDLAEIGSVIRAITDAIKR